jgi:excisionase family DNA binding protein
MTPAEQQNALFVRLTAEQAGRLDRAASALPARKKDLIGGLLERFVHPDTPAGLAALRELTGHDELRRQVTVDLGREQPVVGHAEFRPAPEPQVLDAAQAAALLQVGEAAILELAERGELPGRKIGGAWRFSRRALLDWLSA